MYCGSTKEYGSCNAKMEQDCGIFISDKKSKTL
jgi:hypothetical protein